MKYRHISVKIYDWDVYFFDLGKIFKNDPILKKLSKLIGTKNLRSVESISYSELKNGGDHFFHHNRKTSVVIVYKTSSKKQKISIVLHELQHSVDRICENTRVNDIEARAYLMGYIGSKIIPKL